MKKLLLTVVLTGVAAASFGQGTIQFRNWYANPAVNAPIYVDVVGGVKAEGTAFRAALIAGPVTGTAAIVDAVGGTSRAGNLGMTFSGATKTLSWVNFRTGTSTAAGAGIVNIGSTAVRIVEGVDFGGTAMAQVVAWSGAFTTWDAAFAAAIGGDTTVKIGASNPLTLTLPTSSTSTLQTYLVGLQSFAIQTVPEPSSLALLGLGASAMMIFRRRK